MVLAEWKLYSGPAWRGDFSTDDSIADRRKQDGGHGNFWKRGDGIERRGRLKDEGGSHGGGGGGGLWRSRW